MTDKEEGEKGGKRIRMEDLPPALREALAAQLGEAAPETPLPPGLPMVPPAGEDGKGDGSPSEPQPDTGMACLIMMARFLEMPVDPEPI